MEDQYSHESTPTHSTGIITLCIYPIICGEEKEWKACVTPAFALYNFRPLFPPRPLNLSHMAVCCHNHSQLSKNKPLGCILGTGGWRHHLPDFVLVTITSCDLAWFSSYNLRREYGQGSDVRVYSVIQFKVKDEAKIEIQPHEEAGTRNSLFDGYIFQWCNDGVSLVGFKSSPPFMIWGRVVAHVVSLLCASA